MFDNYLYVAKRGGVFAAGIGKCKIEGSDNPFFLFTTLRILRVTHGSAKWRVGAKLLELHTGDIVFVNNAEPRRFVCVEDAPFEADVFALSPALLSMETSLFSLFYGGITSPIVKGGSQIGKKVSQILDTVQDLSKESGDFSDTAVHLLLSAACLIKTEFKATEKSVSVSSAYAVARAIALISEELESIEDVSDVARRVGLSREHFSVLFVKLAGTTPALYLRRARLERVIYILKCENVNILDAALACGFSSSSGFYRAFSSEFGISPRELLKGR